MLVNGLKPLSKKMILQLIQLVSIVIKVLLLNTLLYIIE
nr:MAG TPA: hypothetical protein [Caudoviricetes sp.]